MERLFEPDPIMQASNAKSAGHYGGDSQPAARVDWDDLLPNTGNDGLSGAIMASIADEYASAHIFLRLILLHLQSFLAASIAVGSPCFFHRP